MTPFLRNGLLKSTLAASASIVLVAISFGAVITIPASPGIAAAAPVLA